MSASRAKRVSAISIGGADSRLMAGGAGASGRAVGAQRSVGPSGGFCPEHGAPSPSRMRCSRPLDLTMSE